MVLPYTLPPLNDFKHGESHQNYFNMPTRQKVIENCFQAQLIQCCFMSIISINISKFLIYTCTYKLFSFHMKTTCSWPIWYIFFSFFFFCTDHLACIISLFRDVIVVTKSLCTFWYLLHIHKFNFVARKLTELPRFSAMFHLSATVFRYVS